MSGFIAPPLLWRRLREDDRHLSPAPDIKFGRESRSFTRFCLICHDADRPDLHGRGLIATLNEFNSQLTVSNLPDGKPREVGQCARNPMIIWREAGRSD